MSRHHTSRPILRARWSAVGAAIAITLGAGGLGIAQATAGGDELPVTITTSPTRILDTRDDLGLSGRFVDATPRDLQVTGTVPVAPSGTAAVVPSDAVAVLVNVTVVRPTHRGFLSLRPAGATGTPTTSTVNFEPGTVEPNAATVDLGPGGKVQLWVDLESNAGTAHVLLDVVGYTVDHAHDDRYYTEDEIDAVIEGLEAELADNEARIAALETAQPFAVGARGLDSTVVTGTPSTLVSVSLTAPVAGSVTVTSSAAGQEGGAGEGPFCSITTGTSVDFDYLQAWQSDGQGASDDWGSLAGTRPYSVTAGQALTVNLVCSQGFNGVNTTVHDPVLTAIFTPAP